MKIYLIGSLRNEGVPQLAEEIRGLGYDVFDDWFTPGPEADVFWKAYERSRGRTFVQALQGHAAKHILEFDKTHLDEADGVVLMAPAGRSGHTELGYALGQGKFGYVLLDDDPDRWDIMLGLATAVFDDKADLLAALKGKIS